MSNSILEKIYGHAQTAGGKKAIIAYDNELTYSELWQRVSRFSEYLRTRGLHKGDCVLVQTAYTASFLISLLAVHLAGAIFVPVDRTSSTEYVNRIIHTTNAKLSIYCGRSGINADCEAICFDESAMINTSPNNVSASLPCKDQSADIVFTTGTTGEAKGVEIQHGALVAGIENITEGFWVEDNIRYLVYGPLNHTFTLRRLYALLYTGNTIVFLEGLVNIRKFFDFIDTYDINATHMNPSAVRIILSLTKDKLAAYASRLKFIEAGTAPFPETDKEKLRQLLPNTRLSFGYGCSESDAVAKFNYSEYPGKSGCVGKPTAHSTIYIVDENRKVIRSSRDKYGLVACKGPMNMKGYWGEPALTKQVITDGVLYTNDIGYFDEDGFLYILGRANEVINVGGIKVAVKEIEDQALMIPGVMECACIAVDDEMLFQVPKLFVVIDEAYTYSSKSIYDALSKTLEAYKLPKYIEEIKALPKTYNGKIQKNLLK